MLKFRPVQPKAEAHHSSLSWTNRKIPQWKIAAQDVTMALTDAKRGKVVHRPLTHGRESQTLTKTLVSNKFELAT